jgi:hypothetical protein
MLEYQFTVMSLAIATAMAMASPLVITIFNLNNIQGHDRYN